MQYQTCECGERIPANELPTKLLTHWNHHSSCLYSYIGCVSKISFKMIYQNRKIEVININNNLSFEFAKHIRNKISVVKFNTITLKLVSSMTSYD